MNYLEGDEIKRYYGVYRGIVKNIKDPQNLHRVAVQVPQVTGSETTDWAWPIVPSSKPPAIGQGVFICYQGGDPEYPLWIGTFGSATTGGSGITPVSGLFSYGAFHDETTQSVTSANTATAMKLGKTDYSNGVRVVGGSKITVDFDGLYNVQFSAQLHGLSGGGNGTTAQIWLDQNGTTVPQSNTKVTVNNNSPYVVASWNFLVYLQAAQYCRLMWAADNSQIKVEASTASPGPSVPSLIVTVTQVA
jgi:hypothetical protein